MIPDTLCGSEKLPKVKVLSRLDEEYRRASALAISVLPVPVCPTNIMTDAGLSESTIPALISPNSVATSATACSCPTITSSKLRR